MSSAEIGGRSGTWYLRCFPVSATGNDKAISAGETFGRRDRPTAHSKPRLLNACGKTPLIRILHRQAHNRNARRKR